MKKRIIAFLCLCVMVLSIFPCVPEKALAAEEFYELKNGQVITLKNASSGWFMNLQHGTDANGTKINVYPWDETPPYTQKYKVSLNADGSFKLATLCAPSRFVDVRRYTETIWYKNLYQTHSEIMAMLVNQVNKGGSFSEDLLNSATATVNESKASLREDILKNRNKQYNIFVRDAFDDLLEKVDTIEVDYNKVYKDILGEYYNSQSLLNKIRSRELIIEVAENEYTKYGKTKAEGADYSTGAWCVKFCSWCAKTAGIPSEVMPLNGTNVWVFKNDVLNRGGKYYDTNTDYIPRPGDFVIYGTQENHDGHIGLIVEVDVEAKKVTTIEGNTSKENGDKTVGYLSKKTRSFNSSLLSGWLSPNY